MHPWGVSGDGRSWTWWWEALGDWVTMAEAAVSSSPEDEDETGELVEDGAEAESQSPSSHSSPPVTTLNIYNPTRKCR